MTKLIFFLFFSLLSPPAFAKRLAVLDFTSVNANQAVLNVMAEMVRNEAANKLSSSGVKVMDQANMLSLLKDQGKDASCLSGECEIELGRNIGADYIFTGQLTLDEGDWILNLSLYETASGSKLTGKTIIKESKKELRNTLPQQTRSLLAKLKRTVKRPKSEFQEGFDTSSEEEDWQASGSEKVVVEFQSSPPGAAVILNGELLCTATPCSQSISAGEHKVNIAKKRYKSKTTLFVAKKNEVVHLKLEPTFGWVSIDTAPQGITVYINDTPIGITPIVKHEIEPGIHTLNVRDPCFKPAKYNFQSTVNTHKTNIPLIELQERKAGIQVTAIQAKNAVDGSVSVDGQQVGTTGQVITVPLCSQKITVEHTTRRGSKWVGDLNLKEKTVQQIRAEFNENTGLLSNLEDLRETGLGLAGDVLNAGLFGLSGLNTEKGLRVKENKRGRSAYGKGSGGYGNHSTAKTRMGNPTIMGGLDKSLIRKVIKRHLGQIKYCYQRELTKNPSLSGRIDVKFVVAKDGSVLKASIKKSTMNSKKVEHCLVSRIKRLQFPEPNGGGLVFISWPFLFNSQ